MQEAFVYRWINKTTGRIYLGYHKGSTDDGYICSSKSDLFWEHWNNTEVEWCRDIIYEGTLRECIDLETWILSQVNLKDDSYYNQNVAGGIVMSDEIRAKLSRAHKGKVIPKEVRAKMSASSMGELNPMYNRRGLDHPSSKAVNIFCYKSNRLVAANVCLSRWAKDNGYIHQCLQQTAVGNRRQHKGLYAVFIKESNTHEFES